MDGMYIAVFINYVRYVHNWLLDCIAPPLCAYCTQLLAKRSVLCDCCKSQVVPLVSVSLFINASYTMSVMCIGEYKDPLKKLILAKGHADYIASHELGQLLYDMTTIKDMQFDFIVPVPLHWSRSLYRGYNQAHEMAIVLSERLQIPCVPLLKRTRATAFQSSVVHTERKHNVKHAFAFTTTDIQQYTNKRILIVDDLMTTGSTLKSIAHCLIGFNPMSLHAIVVSRVK